MELDYISALPGTGKTKWAVTYMTEWSENPDGIYMYVAPSSALLQEVQKYLKLNLPKSKHSRIELIDAKTTGAKVVERITSRLVGSSSKFGRTEKAPKGTILLITHAAFLLMKKVPNSHRIHLIFDEARKCITQPYVLTLNAATRKKILSLYQLDVVDKYFVQAKPKAPPDKVAKTLSGFNLPPSTARGLSKLSEAIANPRLEVFLSLDKNSNSSFEVVLPSVIFDGFKSVTLMSAFFEDSQMYHLLKKRKVSMTDITEVALQNYKYRTSLIKKRYSKIDMVTLCPDEPGVLSKTKLDGMLVPLKHESKIVQALNDLDVFSKSELVVLKNSLSSSSFTGNTKVDQFQRAWLRQPDLIQLYPIKWLLKATDRVICQWGTENPYSKMPLVILNAEEKKRYLNKLPQYKVETTNLHGLNEYLDHNVVAFLAAVNPSRKMIAFYSRYLPGYNQAKDHVAEVCVQCVCRISIRDIKATERTLVIVPDRGIAALLSEKLDGRPRPRTDLEPEVGMTYVVLSGKTKVRRVKKGLNAKERFSEWIKDPVNLVVSRLRARAAYNKARNPEKAEKILSQIEEIKRTRVIPKSLKALAETKRSEA